MTLPGADVYPDDVRAVYGELASHRDAAAGAERQFVNALVLRMLGIKLVDVHHHRIAGSPTARPDPSAPRPDSSVVARHEQKVSDVRSCR